MVNTTYLETYIKQSNNYGVENNIRALSNYTYKKIKKLFLHIL